MSTNIKLNSILREGIDGKRAYDIYLLNKECEYIFIGDLHSDDMSLQRALKEVDFYNKVIKDEIRLVFTGDYVDRGHTHLKVLERVMILKYLYPKNVFLIRGNHDGGVIEEDGSITLPYKAVGQDINELYFPYYLRELSRVNKSFDIALLPLYLEFFNSLAYVCGVYNDKLTIMAVHGGIPRGRIQENGEGMYTHLKCFADITSKDIRDELGNDMTNNIIWSDPYRGIGEIRSKNRRFHFTNDQFNSFKNRFGFDLLIRGHEECEEGFRYHFNNELVTIFSSGGQHFYCDKNFGPNTTNDESAYENILPRVLSIVPKGEIRFI